MHRSKWESFIESQEWKYLKEYITDRYKVTNDLLCMDPEARGAIGPGYAETDDKIRGRMAELKDFITAVEDPSCILLELEEEQTDES
jgi:hypothetical protein